MRVLIVDDNPDILSSVSMGLKHKGFEVEGYEDPEEALREFRPGKYDVAILDVRMPKMNGFQLYREILKIDPNVRVRFFTAFEEYRMEFRQAFPELDQANFIKKPASIAEIVEEISTPLIRK